MVATQRLADRERSPDLSIDEIEVRLRPPAETEPRLLGLYLFGSRATGTEHAASDVDLGALFSKPLEIFELIDLADRG